MEAITVRIARREDAAALRRLAELDAAEVPDQPMVVAEVDGELVAAVPVGGEHGPLADPFRPTAGLVRLLAMRARQLEGVDQPIVRRLGFRLVRPSLSTE